MQRKVRHIDERDQAVNRRNPTLYEREVLRDSCHRSRIKMARMQRRARETGKVPLWFLKDDEDWTPEPMDAAFWAMVVGGLIGLRRYLSRSGVMRPKT